jgi:hypothetical protein
MAFGRRNNAHAAPTTDYGAPAVRSNRLHRPLMALNHALHLASSLIVLGISAYFIHDFENSTHLRYWVAIVCHPFPQRTHPSMNTIVQATNPPCPGLRLRILLPPRARTPGHQAVQGLPRAASLGAVVPMANRLHFRSAGLRVQRWV